MMTRGMQGRLLARSLILQACWSFERMQGLGLVYCLSPWLARCHRRGADRREAQARHAGYFNTQPYMASLIIGMICALEEESASSAGAEREARLKRLAALKAAAAGALAGIGDALFWGALRPFAAALALNACLILGRLGCAEAALWSAVLYLAAYNAAALALRWRGLRLGYDWRDRIAGRLKEFPWQGWIRGVRRVGAVLALAALVLGLAWAELPGERSAGFLTFAAAWLLLGLGPASSARLYAAACLLGGLASAVGWGPAPR